MILNETGIFKCKICGGTEFDVSDGDGAEIEWIDLLEFEINITCEGCGINYRVEMTGLITKVVKSWVTLP